MFFNLRHLRHFEFEAFWGVSGRKSLYFQICNLNFAL
jgi:hypothetical protein